MPRFLFGNSYDSIAQQELQRDSARDARFFNTLNQRRALEQLFLQQQQAGVANAMDVARLASANREFQYRNQLGQQDRKDRWLDRMLQNKQFYDSLAANERTAGLRYGDTAGERDFSEAFNAINEGLAAPDQLPAMFPRVNPTQQNRLAQYFRTLAQQESSDLDPIDAQSRAIADALNTQLSEKRFVKGVADLKEAAKKAKKGWNWMPGPWQTEGQIDAVTEKRIKDLTEGRGRGEVQLSPTELSSFLADALKNKAIAWDSDKEAFVPLPISRRFSLKQLGPSVSSSGAMPAIPAAGAVTAPPAAGLAPALIKMAEDAIAKGADPTKVKARLAAMLSQP